MDNGTLSASDVALLSGNNGFGDWGGNSMMWIFALLILAGGGFGGFGFGNNGFANAEVSRCNAQTNTLQAMNGLAMSLQNCCCENRAGLADLKYTVATEACSDRAAVNDGVRDIMAANAANTQALINSTNAGFTTIMDKICQLELDGKNQQIAQLQAQLNEANRRASQNDQTAQILASQAAQTAALEQCLRILFRILTAALRTSVAVAALKGGVIDGRMD